MNIARRIQGAIDAPNQVVEVGGRTLVYRAIGAGKPLVLCTRFRGTLDDWDPAFLDALAANGLQVITFDYSGLGLSTGAPTYDPIEMAQDPHDLIEALDLRDVVIGGWSIGGMAAQAMLALHPARLSHAVLIATVPPGPIVKPAEQLFYDTASLETYGIEEETILFFEPRSPASRAAASSSARRIAQRTKSHSVPVPIEFARARLGTGPKSPPYPADAILEAMKRTAIPILHVGGDHDIIFPVENWYALNQVLPTLNLLTYPQSGHGPQHQHPRLSADAIASFIRNT